MRSRQRRDSAPLAGGRDPVLRQGPGKGSGWGWVWWSLPGELPGPLEVGVGERGAL